MGANRLKIEPTTDKELIKSILTSDCLWGLISEPNIDKESFEPDLNNFAYLKIEGSEVIGLYMIDKFNGYTINVHPAILKKYRSKYANDSFSLFEDMVKERMPKKIKSMICFIPEVYRNCVIFALRQGFKKCGSLPNSTVRNGVLMNQTVMSKVL